MTIEQPRGNVSVGRSAGSGPTRRPGAARYTLDPDSGGHVRELPDGTRQLVRFMGGRDLVIGQMAPKKS